MRIFLNSLFMRKPSIMIIGCTFLALITSRALTQVECVSIVNLTEKEKHIFRELSLYSPMAIRHVNLAVHVVRFSNGTGGISQNDINTSIEQLNTAFGPVMIAFTVASTDYINNDTYAIINNGNEVDELWALGYNQSNVLNVYYVVDAYFNGIASMPGRQLIVRNAVATNGSTLAHEVGHNLSLLHTHGIGEQEFVNGTNCTTAGDYICDTPAEPYRNDSGILGYVNSSCQYTGTFRDPNDELFNPDTRNFMGYSLPSCRDRFSTQQMSVMNTYLSFSDDYLLC